MKRRTLGQRGRHRGKVVATVAILALALVLPLLPYAFADSHVRAPGQDKPGISPTAVPSPGIDLWNDVRRRPEWVQQRMGEGRPVEGRSQVQGIQTGVLINATGDRWRTFRRDQLVPYSAWFLGGSLVLIAVFFAVRGRIRIEGGRSGKIIRRFEIYDRVLHWFMAILFIILGVTGLILLYGRYVLIPLLGPEGFSITAAASKEVHNLFGPIFPLAIIILLVRYAGQNLPEKGDFKWLMRGGGFFGGEHVKAGYMNAGEKILFWLTVIFGLAISVSGLILDFPVFGQGREIMGISHVVHGIVAAVFIALIFGHIFMAAILTEGTVDGMYSGYVDSNWAKMHHAYWAEEQIAAGNVADADDEVAARALNTRAEIPGG